MLARLDEVASRWRQLQEEQASPEVLTDPRRLMEVSKKLSEIEPVVLAYQEYRRLRDEHVGARELLAQEHDPELRVMAEEEIERLDVALAATEQQLKLLLLPVDPNDRRNVILEVRAGTGGEEAALFAPAESKIYRHPTFYDIPETVKNI